MLKLKKITLKALDMIGYDEMVRGELKKDWKQLLGMLIGMTLIVTLLVMF